MEHYKVHPKETIYFVISAIMSVLLVTWMVYYFATTDIKESVFLMVILFYAGFFAFYFFIVQGLFIGYLAGNAVKITKNQLPDIYNILEEQSRKLGLKEVPTMYILQSGGILNAFATHFFDRKYIVLYSDILEAAYEEGKDAVEFIIGHELGHIKRNHMLKMLLVLPAIFVPFLFPAYSRACEYTCDNIGKFLAPTGAQKGMLILASGKKLYKMINIDEYFRTFEEELGFWKWFAEKVSSHPHLPKRMKNLAEASVPSNGN